MSTIIDERVVEMRFDNKRFENNVQTSLSSLDKLKKSLNMDGASKGFEEIDNAAKKINMSGLGSAVETVRMKFSALEVMAITALANITNSAINAGKQLVSSFTIEPIKMGFQEYETQINAIQTILANTESKGSTLKDVNNALDELNTYADKTIYNFTEMTRNIGTFTAAGVDLDTSVSAIKGIANLAAVSGSNSQQASTAMYQLSQALASGTVKLQDWNSVVNAGMGGQVFQDALKETARVHGIAIDKMIKSEGSFRETLKDGWLTSEVLTETLAKFTGDLNENQLRTMGYTEEQIASIMKMGQTANDAATKVKTFTQLFDTLKEAAQSGWTQSWEIIVGDFEEAKELLTDVSNAFGGMIEASASARNEMLQSWKDLGGRTAIIEAVQNAFQGIASIVTPIKEAFREIFPPLTAKQLYSFTEGLRKLTERMTLSETISKNLKSTFKGLFAVVNIVGKAFSAVFKAVGSLLGGVGELGGGILSVTGSFGEWLIKLNEIIERTDIFNKVFGTIAGIIKTVATGIKDFVTIIAEKFKIPGFELFHSLLERVQIRMSQIGEIAGNMKSGVVVAFEVMGEAIANCQFVQLLKAIWNAVKTTASDIVNALGQIGGSLSSSLGEANFSGIIDLLNGISFGAIAIGITKFVGGFRKAIDEIGSIKESFIGILDGVRGCFEAYQTQLQAGTLLKIASAIAILSASLVALSLIDSDKLNGALAGITVLFADLMASMAIFNKISGQATGVFKSTMAMLGMSTSVLILASALKKIGDLDIKQITTGLIGVTGLTAIMVVAAKAMSSGGTTIVKGATQMVIFAAAIKVLASACEDLSALDWNQLAKGLVGVGVLLAEVSLFLNNTKFSGKAMTTATGIVILSAAIKVLASACEDFGNMKWEEIGKGLASIGILLAEIAAFTNLTGNAKHVISTGVALVVIGAAMKIFASAVKDFSTMNWDEIARGLVAMAGALAAVTVAVNFMPKNMAGIGTRLIAVSTALIILANALGKMSGMSWEEIAKGLVTLGGAMGIMAIGLNAMTGTLAGSAAMLVAASALLVLTPVLSILGAMSWTSIVKGLVTLAGAFTIIGVAGLVLTPLVPTILGLSGAIALIGVAVLGIGAGLALAGAGLSALAIGFTALAAAGTAGATAIVASLTVIITGIAGLIPAIVAKIGEAIVEFCKVIANSAGEIGNAVKTVILTLVDVLVECVPAIADGALKLIAGVLEALVKYTPKIVDSLFQFLIGVLDGIARNLPGLIQAAIDVLMSFFSGVVDALKGIDTETLLQGVVGIGLLSAIMVALSAVAGLVPGAMVGVLGMGVIITELALVLAAVGALAQIPGLQWLINEGGNLLQGIGTAIGKFIGGIVGGFMSGVSSQFSKIGADLSEFMISVQPFLYGASKINSSTMDGVKALAEVILLLTAADILQGLTSWFTGGKSMSGFADELVPFGKAMKAFSEEVKGIDGDTVSNAAIAGKTLAEMAATLPNSGGVVGFFTGDNDLGEFAYQLVPFGEAMVAFGKAVKGLDSDAVKNASVAGKAMAEMASTLPNTGGVVGFFAGENDMDIFAEQLVPFGEAMKRFSDSVRGMDPDAIINSATAGKALVELASTVPNSGGVIGFFTGENDMDIFGEQLIAFGISMKSYADSISGIDTKAIIASATAGQALAELETNLPDVGGLSTIISGGNSLAQFAYELIPFGKAMKSYSDSINGIDPKAVTTSGIAAMALAKLESNLPDIGGLSTVINGGNSLASFAYELVPFGEAMKSYAESVAGINSNAVAASAVAAKSLAELEANLPAIGGLTTIMEGSNSLRSFATELPSFGKGMKSYAESVTGIDADAVVASAIAAQSLSKLEENLPDIGGLSVIIEGSNSLGQFAAELIPFGEAMKSYSDSIKGIDSKAVTESAIAAQSLSELATNLPDVGGFMNWFNGDNDLGNFAKGLIPFGESMKAYADSVAGIDTKAVVASAVAAKSLAELAANLPSVGGFASWIDGQNDLGNFAKGLIPFGEGMNSYSDSVIGIDSEAVTASAVAALSLAELEAKLPECGGFASWINGSKSLGAFAEGLIPFGEAMKSYSDGIVGIDTEAVAASATAALSLTELANKLPSIGGFSQWFNGSSDMAVFGGQLASFGEAMKTYSKSISGIDTEAVINSTTAGQAIAELANTLPNTGGFISGFIGDNDISAFGNSLVSFGKNFSQYAAYMKNVNSSVLAATTNAASSIVALQKSLPKQGGWFSDDMTLSNFGSDMSNFGYHFSNYYSHISGINTSQISAVIAETNKLVSMAKGMTNLDTSGMSSFARNLTNLGNAGIDGFISTFTNANAKVSSVANTMITTFINSANAQKGTLIATFTSMANGIVAAFTDQSYQFKAIGNTMLANLISGINSQDATIRNTFVMIISGCIIAIRNKFEEFHNAGKYLVEGFANGITEYIWYAEAKSRAMARAAAKAAKKELDERSPSKVGYHIGAYFGLAFVNAIGDYADKSYKAGKEMAVSAKDGLRKAISGIRDIVEGKIDVQPTVRPVLDLSEVQSSAGKLSAILSRSQAVKISAGVESEKAGVVQNGDSSPTPGNNYSFIQNNYSPKPLSRLEIYRQTKNQLSAMKGLVVKA